MIDVEEFSQRVHAQTDVYLGTVTLRSKEVLNVIDTLELEVERLTKLQSGDGWVCEKCGHSWGSGKRVVDQCGACRNLERAEEAERKVQELRSVPYSRGPDGEPGPPDLGAYVDLKRERDEAHNEAEMRRDRVKELAQENATLKNRLAKIKDALKEEYE